MAILIVINFRLLHGQALAIFMAIFHLFSFYAAMLRINWRAKKGECVPWAVGNLKISKL